MDSWSTVTSSNVSDQPPSYADTVNDDVIRNQNFANEATNQAFEKGKLEIAPIHSGVTEFHLA